MANFKAVGAVRFRRADFHILDTGMRRALAEQTDHLLNRALLALDMRFDRTVGAVSHPARQSKLPGLFTRPGPKEDPLDAASDPDMAGSRHSSSANAGAYSAVPTAGNSKSVATTFAWK